MKPPTNKRHRRRAKRVPQTQQRSLFSFPLATMAPPDAPAQAGFLHPSPETIFLGDVPLRRYLEQHDLALPLRLRRELATLDYSSFYTRYDTLGRQAIHPQAMLGLIFYGILEGQSSLRALEKLAKRDVGAWWMTGGLQPDHRTIGSFLQRHAQELSEEFFLTLTRQLCRKLKLSSGTAAADGTVIEAAASHYRLLTAEAAHEAAAQAPDNAPAQKTAAIAEKREADRRARGDKTKPIKLSPVEPEALVQKQKGGGYRPSYKPSVLTHESGLIVGQWVEPGAESSVLPTLLAQHEAVLGALPQRTLLDAGYHTHEVLGLFASLELDVLCPSGKASKGRWTKQGVNGLFAKHHFLYDEASDVYRCPAGYALRYRGKSHDRHGRPMRTYHGAPCGDCPLRAQCTRNKDGRVIRRLDADQYKEAMAQVMAQPAARRVYAKRRAIVEPVFAELRERQDLKRFRRRGLDDVRLEFSLHCMALNLKRFVRLSAPFSGDVVVSFLLIASPHGFWCKIGLHIQ